MALGPGKYDDLCTEVRERSKASGAIVIIFNGENGDGFSAQLPYEDIFKVPDILRQMAETIGKDVSI